MFIRSVKLNNNFANCLIYNNNTLKCQEIGGTLVGDRLCTNFKNIKVSEINNIILGY